MATAGWLLAEGRRRAPSRQIALQSPAGQRVNDKRVERLWRREGLKEPMKQPKKGRLWLNNGSCVRLRPEHRNHVWSYDFVHHRTDDGRAFRTLNILDEHSRECPLSAMHTSPAGQRDDPGEAETELYRGHRCADRPVYPAWCACLHSLGQRPMRGMIGRFGVRLLSHRGVSTRSKHGSVWHFGQRTVSPITNTEYAFAALTVLKTRSSVVEQKA